MRIKILCGPVVSCAVVLGVSVSVQAQNAASQSPEQLLKTAEPAGSATATDPNIDRGFLLPTAMTQPAGSITYNNYELLLHGVTYGITDKVQTTLTVLSPLTRDMPVLGFAAVKGQIVDLPRVHLSLQGSTGWEHTFSTTGVQSDGNDLFMVGAGAIGSLCLRDDCSSLLSASAIYQYFVPSGSGQSAGFLFYGASLVHGVSSHVKLLAEVTSAAKNISSSSDAENLGGFFGSYGVRLHNDTIAGDVGFIKPFLSNDDDGLLLGVPFVNFSVRWR